MRQQDDSDARQPPTYDRPDAPFVCGHLDDGQPCALGPNHDGSCPLAMHLDDAGGIGVGGCTRSRNKNHDGPTTACTPRPTWSRRRRRMTWLVVGTGTLLLIAVMLGIPGGRNAHSRLLKP
ncbi:MAG: hypothetical protein AAFP69_18890, partial [Planctomycetota bacterium]